MGRIRIKDHKSVQTKPGKPGIHEIKVYLKLNVLQKRWSIS